MDSQENCLCRCWKQTPSGNKKCLESINKQNCRQAVACRIFLEAYKSPNQELEAI